MARLEAVRVLGPLVALAACSVGETTTAEDPKPSPVVGDERLDAVWREVDVRVEARGSRVLFDLSKSVVSGMWIDSATVFTKDEKPVLGGGYIHICRRFDEDSRACPLCWLTIPKQHAPEKCEGVIEFDFTSPWFGLPQDVLVGAVELNLSALKADGASKRVRSTIKVRSP